MCSAHSGPALSSRLPCRCQSCFALCLQLQDQEYVSGQPGPETGTLQCTDRLRPVGRVLRQPALPTAAMHNTVSTSRASGHVSVQSVPERLATLTKHFCRHSLWRRSKRHPMHSCKRMQMTSIKSTSHSSSFHQAHTVGCCPSASLASLLISTLSIILLQLLQPSSSLSQALTSMISGALVHKDTAFHGWVACIHLHNTIAMKSLQCSSPAQAEQVDDP